MDRSARYSRKRHAQRLPGDAAAAAARLSWRSCAGYSGPHELTDVIT